MTGYQTRMTQTKHPTQERSGDGESTGLVQDLKALPDDLRAWRSDVEQGLDEAVARDRRLDYMLDLKTALIAVAVTLAVGLVMWLIGVPVLIGTVIAVIVLGAALFVVAEIRREPPPRDPAPGQG
jgi:Flp pilus assembly protein TadB